MVGGMQIWQETNWAEKLAKLLCRNNLIVSYCKGRVMWEHSACTIDKEHLHHF